MLKIENEYLTQLIVQEFQAADSIRSVITRLLLRYPQYSRADLRKHIQNMRHVGLLASPRDEIYVASSLGKKVL